MHESLIEIEARFLRSAQTPEEFEEDGQMSPVLRIFRFESLRLQAGGQSYGRTNEGRLLSLVQRSASAM